jgi:hypothetical protein
MQPAFHSLFTWHYPVDAWSKDAAKFNWDFGNARGNGGRYLGFLSEIRERAESIRCMEAVVAG